MEREGRMSREKEGVSAEKGRMCIEDSRAHGIGSSTKPVHPAHTLHNRHSSLTSRRASNGGRKRNKIKRKMVMKEGL